MSETPEQKILELEAKVKLLEKQKARAEHLAERADKKVIIFDMLVDMAEKEYDIQIRKNYTPDLSPSSKKNTKKR
jgi:transposase